MKILVKNRKATFNYDILDKLEAGIKLVGTEVKSVKQGNMQISESFVQIKNGEIFLIGSHIETNKTNSYWQHQPTRTRKLLLHKKEINKLTSQVKTKGYTIIPLEVYIKNGYIKVLIGLAKGKHSYDKRETLKQKTIKMDVSRQLKNANFK
jgi:SsrA-binding protein